MSDQSTPVDFSDDGFHRHLVDYAVDPFVVVGDDLVMRYVGPTIIDFVGWGPDEWVGRSIADFLSPESLELAAHGMLELDEVSFDPDWLATPMQVNLRTKAGDWCTLEVTVRPFERPAFSGYLVQLHPASAADRLHDVARAILDGRDETEILTMLPSLLAHDIPGTEVGLGFDWTGDGFAHVAGDQELLSLAHPVGTDRDLLDWLIESESTVHVLTDLLAPATRVRAAAAGYPACWGVPIVTGGERRAGAVAVLWHWTVNDPGVILGSRVLRIVDLARLVLRWADSQRQLSWDVSHDQLTGLMNRSAFMELIAASAGRGRGMLFCDLDDFKPVNDRFGHRTGDRVLQTVADRLRIVCRDHVVARLSGDEFAVLVEPATDGAQLEAVAERIRRAISQPVVLGSRAATIGISIGVAFDPKGEATADHLIDEADRMLRRSKSRGKNQLGMVVLGD